MPRCMRAHLEVESLNLHLRVDIFEKVPRRKHLIMQTGSALFPPQDRIRGAAASAPCQNDALLSADDELDAHPAMLPLVQLMERGAALWEQVHYAARLTMRFANRTQAGNTAAFRLLGLG